MMDIEKVHYTILPILLYMYGISHRGKFKNNNEQTTHKKRRGTSRCPGIMNNGIKFPISFQPHEIGRFSGGAGESGQPYTGKFIYQVLPFILQYIISLRKDMKLSEFGYLPDTF